MSGSSGASAIVVVFEMAAGKFIYTHCGCNSNGCLFKAKIHFALKTFTYLVTC